MLLRYRSGVQCCVMLCFAVWCDPVQCCTVRCGAMLYGAMRCDAVLCSAMRCNAVRCGAMQCDAVWCGSVVSLGVGNKERGRLLYHIHKLSPLLNYLPLLSAPTRVDGAPFLAPRQYIASLS